MSKGAIEKLIDFIKNIDTCADVCESMTCLNYNNCSECIVDYLKENLNLLKED